MSDHRPAAASDRSAAPRPSFRSGREVAIGGSPRRASGPVRPLDGVGVGRAVVRLGAAAVVAAAFALSAAAAAGAAPEASVASVARVASVAHVAHADVAARVPAVAPAAPSDPTPPASPGAPNISVGVSGGVAPSQSVTIIVLMTVLSVAPALLLLMTSFTKIAVVLALTRQALGTPTIPPNQVLAGLALFLSMFVMGPVVSQVNDQALQPFLQQKITQNQAVSRAYAPMREFMLAHTGKEELQTMIKLSREAQPQTRANVSFTTLVPAFVISELKTAFIIGFVIFIPFLIIDLVVASVLMSMGMMMLPPVMISLPFKLLLFIMVNGWSLITTALVTSYATGG